MSGVRPVRGTHMSCRVLGALVALCLFVTATGWTAPTWDGRGEDIAVVVHRATGVDEISFDALRRICLGEQQFWPDKTRVVLLIHAPGTRLRDVVLIRVYQMNEVQFKRYWIAKVFRAEISAGPKIVSDVETARRLAGALPGAISFLPMSQVTEQVKVLRINGKLPGENGYVLHDR
jgi:hypothetical protein